MISKKIYILCSMLFAVFAVFSQAVSLPFYLNKYKHIIVNYSIKGEKVKFLFDTGWEGCILDTVLANKLNILPHKQCVKTIRFVSSGQPYSEIIPNNSSSPYIDSLFNYAWTLTDMKATAKSLSFDENINGIVGIDFQNNKYIVELDFKHSRLNFWDSLPQNYPKGRKMHKVELVRSDYMQETKYSNNFATYPYIKGTLTILDTVRLQPLFFFDTGNTGSYITLQMYDNSILKKMTEYKRMIVQKYGNNYPTIRFQLPELEIDSLYANCIVTRAMPDIFNLYKVSHMRVLLGMDFFLQYERVIFDVKKRTGYFVKCE
jgi:hypothetical protein